MSRKTLILLAALPLAACGLSGTDDTAQEPETVATQPEEDFGYDTFSDENLADSMASDDGPYTSVIRDPAEVDGSSDGAESSSDGNNNNQIADPEQRPIMQLQVVLDRQGFGPGVIDGEMGTSTRNAIQGFQEANGLEITGQMNDETQAALARWERIPATRVVTVPARWGELDFTEIPDDPAAQAEMEQLGYETLDEKLAERFHTTVEVLQALNPNRRPAGAPASNTEQDAANGSELAENESAFSPGQQIRVPNIGADRIAPDSIQDRGWMQTLASLGVGSEQPTVARIVVDESEGWLKGYDEEDNLVAMFTVTTGSENDPLPIGEWGINGVGHNPPFSYQPDLFWDVPDDEEEQMLPPGPNGPVGVVWIDLTKEHYGIHGTSAPETIGRAQSHGCVRLTNWDAARLSEMVGTSTQVIFQA